MVPTLAATLGVKGHRPTVGTRDCKDLLYVFGVVNLATAVVHANTLESPKDAKKKTGPEQDAGDAGGVRRHLRHIGRMYRGRRTRGGSGDRQRPCTGGRWWTRVGREPAPGVPEVAAYSPQLNPIERFWKKLRRRATTTACSTP